MKALRLVLGMVLVCVTSGVALGTEPEDCAHRAGPRLFSLEHAALFAYGLVLLPVEVPWTVVGAIRASRNDCSVLAGFADGLADVVGHAEGVWPAGVHPYPVEHYACRVSGDLWRGAWVDADGVRSLRDRGVRSIVNLTWEKPDDQRSAAATNGLHYLSIPIVDGQAPSEKNMIDFLEFVTMPENQPAYVHCEAGEGRTGVAVAAYRMAVEGWEPGCAVAEARHLGLTAPAQRCFLDRFAADLLAGHLEPYPLKPRGTVRCNGDT